MDSTHMCLWERIKRTWDGLMRILSPGSKLYSLFETIIEKNWSLHEIVNAYYFEKVRNSDTNMKAWKAILEQFMSDSFQKHRETFNVNMIEILNQTDDSVNTKKLKSTH